MSFSVRTPGGITFYSVRENRDWGWGGGRQGAGNGAGGGKQRKRKNSLFLMHTHTLSVSSRSFGFVRKYTYFSKAASDNSSFQILLETALCVSHVQGAKTQDLAPLLSAFWSPPSQACSQPAPCTLAHGSFSSLVSFLSGFLLSPPLSLPHPDPIPLSHLLPLFPLLKEEHLHSWSHSVLDFRR